MPVLAGVEMGGLGTHESSTLPTEGISDGPKMSFSAR